MNGIDTAFPVHDGMGIVYHGLSKRELFAAMAMQGQATGDLGMTSAVARAAVNLADALLAALEQP